MKKRNDAFNKSDKQVLFFKAPLDIQKHLAEFTDSELKLYIFFLIQVSYRKTNRIQITGEELRLSTGISNHVTITKNIRGLVEKGWIDDVIFQKYGGNIYVINLAKKINKKTIENLKKHGDKIRNGRSKNKKPENNVVSKGISTPDDSSLEQ